MTVDRRSEGFTLIEIVLVLVLLGILGAVAAYKYFDMQEEANRIKCAYHRSLVIDELQNRWALAVADSDRRSEIFPSAAGAESLVLEDLKSTARESLCPSGGTYEVSDNDGGAEDFENGYVFCVKCSTHGDDGTEMEKCKKSDPTPPEPEPDPDPGPQQDPDKVITVNKAKTLMDYLTDIYSVSHEDAGTVSSIKEFFKVANGDGSAIQSEAKGDYNTKYHNYGQYKSMTEIVNKALGAAGYVTEAIIWRLTSEEESIVGWGDNQHKESYLTLIVVDKSEAEKCADKWSVSAKKIQVRVTFNSRSEGDTSEVKSFGEKTETSVWAKIKTVTNEGEAYLSITSYSSDGR